MGNFKIHAVQHILLGWSNEGGDRRDTWHACERWEMHE